MKEKVMAVLLVMSVLFVGCGAKNTETDVYVPADSSPEENTLTEDIPLQEPPAITLVDPLSSMSALFEVSSGNYSWNFEIDDGVMTGVVACGMHPLDEADHAKLKLPQYQNMDTVIYMAGIASTPDCLIVRKWDAADMGNTDAEELSVVTLNDPTLMLELEAGRIYELTAIWDAEKADTRGFFGEASYAFVTE